MKNLPNKQLKMSPYAVKRRIKKLGIMQKTICDALGITSGNMSAILNGRLTSPGVFKRIVDYLDNYETEMSKVA